MSRRHFRYCLLSAGATGALLAGCGGSGITSPVAVQPTAEFSARAAATHYYESLYSFTGNPDGAKPVAGLVPLNGVLYGTTREGGTGFPTGGGLGTFFSVTTTGQERVLYSFGSGSDADYNPASDLVAVNDALYGVASGGPPYNLGVVYAVTTSGKESVVYSFKGKPYDGSYPVSSLTALDGKLYGDTVSGGRGRCRVRKRAIGCGTVFKISASGAERVLYSFKGRRHGVYPAGNLVAVNGALYGTTVSGGDRSGACSGIVPGYGCGTVFSVSTSGVERELYRFKGPPYDGEPTSSSNGLVALNNVLYGTTTDGGTSGLGTVYVVTLSGKEMILHNFTGGSDGANPSARLKVVKGVLYGTTYAGGASTNCSGGCGTVFSISTSGTEQVLYSFQGGPDGGGPLSDLALLNGRLYGTTSAGGSEGAGTVFRISP